MRPLLLALATGALALGSPPAPPPIEVLVDRIQSHLDEMRDFEARFTQRYVRRIARRVIEEQGVVQIKKPGRMRWDYLSPEAKLFVTDGKKSYFYLPEEKQVIVSQAPTDRGGPSRDSPLALLSGESRLREAFEILPTPSEPGAGGAMLRLVPRHPQEDVEEIEIEVDAESGQIRRVILVDPQANRTEFRFEAIQENQNLPESLFIFTVPPGVEIVLGDVLSVPHLKEPTKP